MHTLSTRCAESETFYTTRCYETVYLQVCVFYLAGTCFVFIIRYIFSFPSNNKNSKHILYLRS